MVTDVSGQHIGPIFEVQAVQDLHPHPRRALASTTQWRKPGISHSKARICPVENQTCRHTCQPLTKLPYHRKSMNKHHGTQFGCATSQAASREPLPADARLQSQVSPCRICGGQSGTGTGFSPSTSVFPHQYHSTSAPNASHRWAGYVVRMETLLPTELIAEE